MRCRLFISYIFSVDTINDQTAPPKLRLWKVLAKHTDDLFGIAIISK